MIVPTSLRGWEIPSSVLEVANTKSRRMRNAKCRESYGALLTPLLWAMAHRTSAMLLFSSSNTLKASLILFFNSIRAGGSGFGGTAASSAMA